MNHKLFSINQKTNKIAQADNVSADINMYSKSRWLLVPSNSAFFLANKINLIAKFSDGSKQSNAIENRAVIIIDIMGTQGSSPEKN
ncbi:hypothetical protein [Shewanella gaetbuli]|uniref:Uncharacterized protein n=1 Tax=Shewanella gaetbuli TaxID=220752 RepID=A0A9X2CLB3_9GAMM|nr:hypothetical protein [Shewanella gaetbuli]MCL1142549.1 hypothetical protein [Shewanella gaetbuli]